MNFFKHTEEWLKGESIEGGMLIVFGAMLVLLALYFRKFSHTPTTRVLFVPFHVVGLFWSVAAGIGFYRSTLRVEEFRAAHHKAPAQFVVISQGSP